MNYHKITRFDTSNGPGIRSVLWVSGCAHHCPGCHNPETWDVSSGKLFTEESLKYLLDSIAPPYIAGVTFSGGDPLLPLNRSSISQIMHEIRTLYPTKSIWVYTGYLYEDIKSLPLLSYVDVLVDGRFILDQKDITLPYAGSRNQRVIDIPRSLLSDEVILWSPS